MTHETVLGGKLRDLAPGAGVNLDLQEEAALLRAPFSLW